MATLKQAIEYAKSNPNDPRNSKLKEMIQSGQFDEKARIEGIDLTGKSQTFSNVVDSRTMNEKSIDNSVKLANTLSSFTGR